MVSDKSGAVRRHRSCDTSCCGITVTGIGEHSMASHPWRGCREKNEASAPRAGEVLVGNRHYRLHRGTQKSGSACAHVKYIQSSKISVVQLLMLTQSISYILDAEDVAHVLTDEPVRCSGGGKQFDAL